MSYLYSLYDALVGINVPTDKARAVVDAKERDMLTRLAVKGDIDAMGARLDALRQEVRMQQELLRSSMTIRLGSMFVVGLSLLFAALKLTGP